MDCAHEEVLTPSLTVDPVTFDQSMMEATSDPPQLLELGTIVEAAAFDQFVMTFALDSPQLMDSSTITPKFGLVIGPFLLNPSDYASSSLSFESSAGLSEITTSSPVTRGQQGIVKPNPRYALAVSPNTLSTSNFEKQELCSPKWKKVVADESPALQKNRTWTLVPRTFSSNVISLLWVFKIKQWEDGTVERLKAHLVAKWLR